MEDNGATKMYLILACWGFIILSCFGFWLVSSGDFWLSTLGAVITLPSFFFLWCCISIFMDLGHEKPVGKEKQR